MSDHQHEAWQLSEDGTYCRACGTTVAPSPEVELEALLIAATRKQAGTHDHRKMNHARGVADALSWVLSGKPKPVAGTSLRDLWEDARPPRS